MDGLRTFETVRFKNISYDIFMRLYMYIYIFIYLFMYLFVYLYFFIYMIPWTEQGTPWINKNLGSQPRRSFLTVLFSPLGRTASVVVPTGLTQTYGFEKKTWYHTKPIKIRPSMFDSYLNRWVWLCLSPLPKLPGAGTSYWSPQHRLLSLPAPGIINHYGPNMIDGGTLYINRLSS